MRIQKQVNFLSFFLRQAVRNLRLDRRSVHVYEKIQKITQVRLVGDNALEQVFPVLGRISEYLHVFGTN